MLTARRAAVALGVAMLSGITLTQTQPYQPIPTTLCDVTPYPERFNGAMIHLRSPIHISIESFELSFETCDARQLSGGWNTVKDRSSNPPSGAAAISLPKTPGTGAGRRFPPDQILADWTTAMK
jgi:hypothetical protein